MHIQPYEVAEFQRILHGRSYYEPPFTKIRRICGYLRRHPHLLMAWGFDECRIFRRKSTVVGTDLESLLPPGSQQHP